MELKDRIAIISHENFRELLNLYGELNIDRLSEIVNHYIKAAVNEIKEDSAMCSKVPKCAECKYVKCYDYVYKNYYCDHEDRPEDIGRINGKYLPETSPEWCPERKTACKLV